MVRTGFRPPPSRRLTRRYRCFAATRRAELRCRSHRPRLPATRGRAVSRICHMAHTISAGGKAVRGRAECGEIARASAHAIELGSRECGPTQKPRSHLNVVQVGHSNPSQPYSAPSPASPRGRSDASASQPPVVEIERSFEDISTLGSSVLHRPSPVGRHRPARPIRRRREQGTFAPADRTAVRARDLYSCPWPEESEGPLLTPWRSRGPLLSLPDRPV